MTENELSIILRRELLAGLARYGAPDIPVEQGYQPTTQGRDEQVIYYWSIGDTPEGGQYRKVKPGTGGEPMVTAETQIIVSQYQIGALVPVDVNNVNQKTAKDLTVLAHMVVKSQPFIQAMIKAGAGVRKPSDVRNPMFVNDQDQYEANPSFDCTFTHKQVIIQATDSTERVELNIHRV